MHRGEMNKDEKKVFIKEWAVVIKILKRSQCDLSKIKLTSEVRG